MELRLGTGGADRPAGGTRAVLVARRPAWRPLVGPLGARVKKVVALHIDRRPTDADEVVVFQDEDAFRLPLRYRGHRLFSYPPRSMTWTPTR
jgi:D-arginine dehydrogenase